jgi:hypothetical protein
MFGPTVDSLCSALYRGSKVTIERCVLLDEINARLQVLTVVSMKMAVFWVVAPCRLVEVHRRFIATITDAGTTFETSITFYQSTRRNNPDAAVFEISLRWLCRIKNTLRYTVTCKRQATARQTARQHGSLSV